MPCDPGAPLFVQADFGLDRYLEPKLVEIQGFPSLYAYQPLMADCYREAFGIGDHLQTLPGNLSLERYQFLLGQSIVGGSNPENVVLLEIQPQKQKTRADFRRTEQIFGVRTVDVETVRKQGNKLFYEYDGRLIPIDRIYNRVIVDEVERKGIHLPFDWRDDLDVEWAGHPGWFFRLSKFSLPYLTHTAVPETQFLHLASGVDDPAEWVLKPLYSFAGTGVIVGPTQAQIDAVPEDRRADYILQKRVDFHPVIETPHGAAKVEVRIMYLQYSGRMNMVNTIIRMGRGTQMGVDFNKGLDWVGASAAFIEGSSQ
ncbi:MAG: hypothetical protein H7Y20_17885 [Bryobacteraceae bacterium]|nr:hypothetical protein [Bryobacteraceae bacterium]